jgi:hypothetical protein
LIDFATHCIKESQNGKSIYKKRVVVAQMMKQYGKAKLLKCSRLAELCRNGASDREGFELAKVFKACTQPEESAFKFFAAYSR